MKKKNEICKWCQGMKPDVDWCWDCCGTGYVVNIKEENKNKFIKMLMAR